MEHKVYKKSKEEESQIIIEEFLAKGDEELENTEFCKVLKEKFTQVDLSPNKSQKYFYVIIC